MISQLELDQPAASNEKHRNFKRIVVALAGNPNSGKTTMFNRLTGARQHVGNYPGVTVERKSGSHRHGEVEMQVVDLPGTYSLTAFSVEERVARNFIIGDRPDVVIDIVDATNLERNLYLAVQLMELGAPLVLAFNMCDTTRAQGVEFNLSHLSEAFGAPVVLTSGGKGDGIAELMSATLATAKNHRSGRKVDYGPVVEKEIAFLQGLIEKQDVALGCIDKRWLAIKLLENDPDIRERYADSDVTVQMDKSLALIEAELGDSASSLIAARRYDFISQACELGVLAPQTQRRTMSDRIDSLATHRFLGLPLFLAVMYLVFQLTFTASAAPMNWIESFFGWLEGVTVSLWPEGSESPLKSLLSDGLIAGVGGVLVFMPNILCLFFAIALLEDSGYMARAAFIMDRLMHKIGLHGKSFIPMLIGFGCSIPAIMATRTLESRRDRLATMMVIPLMSCGARLPIYSLIIPAFFPEAWRAPMLWLIYVLGIVLAVCGAKLIRSTVLKGDSVPFIMELPPYRIPTVSGIAIHMWERGWLYLKKAGTIILGLSILLWALTTYPKKTEFEHNFVAPASPAAGQTFEEFKKRIKEAKTRVDLEQRAEMLDWSAAGRIGHAMEPAIAPLGFDWRIGTALIGAFAAKEVFVAQMAIVFASDDANENSGALREKLRTNYTPLTAFCVMLFCLISTPCMATIATTRKESGSWSWALAQWAGLTIMGYILTLLVYQGGKIMGIGL